MTRQDKHKIATTLRVATHKSKLLLSHKFLILLPAAATLGVLALVSVLFTSADTASNTYAANLGSQITTEVDGQYYVTLTAPDVNFSVSPSKNENAAKQRIDVGVETNVAGGAKLYLSMTGSSNSLHLNGNTAQASPVIAAVPDGTDASSFPANTWGYSTDDQTYSAVPTTASDPALLANVDGETTGTTSGSVISASIPVYYAANVDTSIPSGSYSNRMTYSAVVDGGITAEATLTSIKVNGVTVQELQKDEVNTITVTTNLMVSSFGVPRVIYRTTDPSGYQECGNVLVQKDSEGYMAVTCEVTPTQPATGITLEIIPRGSEGDVFCADGTYVQGTSDCEEGSWKWGNFVISVPDISVPFNDITSMQEMTSEICADAKENDATRLEDIRDGKLYWIGKLPDGNCWMTQNLDLDLSTSNTFTPADTNISSNWTPSISTTTTISGYSSSDRGRSYNPGDIYYENTSGTDQHYHVGNYYQWSAATAGYTGTSQSTQSICPAGWMLPRTAQLRTLINSGLTDSNFMNAPYYLLRGGNLYDSSLLNAGSQGDYWSSTPNGSSHAYYLRFYSGNSVNPGNIYIETDDLNSRRYYGFSVRCVAAG